MATAVLFNYPRFHAQDSTGNALVGGKLYTYAPGTTTPKATYSDINLSVANTNPVILDPNGDAVVYMSGSYDIVLKDSSDVVQWTMTDINKVTSTSVEVDVLNDYGAGSDYTQASIDAALASIGTSTKTTLLLRPGTWTFNANKDYSAYTNIVFKIPIGAMLSHGTYTLQIYNPPEAGPYQIFTGAGTVTISTYPQDRAWWGESERFDVNGLSINGVVAPTGGYPYYMAQLLDNVNFTATIAAKALTVTLIGVNGSALSASNIAKIAFRNATLTNGALVVRTVTAPVSITLSSGSTLGFTSASAGRIYVWAIDSAGTVVLGLSRTAVYSESALMTTTAEGGAGGADSTTVIYTTATQTNKAIRCIGYIEIVTGATPGEWDNAPTALQVIGYGVRRTGDIIQRVESSITASGGIATAIPYDNTTPQNTEGDEILTVSIAPTSILNLLLIDLYIPLVDGSTTVHVTAALFRDSTADAIASATVVTSNVGVHQQLMLKHSVIAGSVAATIFKIRLGPHSGKAYYLKMNSGDVLNGTLQAILSVTEIMA